MADCIIAPGAPDRGGYIKVRFQGKKVGAHRVAFYRAHGFFPPVVRHTCDNPPCIEPSHLLDGSQAENIADRVARGRSARGESNGRAKLTQAQVAEIRSRATTESQRSLGRAFGVSQMTISAALRGRTWKA